MLGDELVTRIDLLLTQKNIQKKQFYSDLKLPNNACTKWSSGTVPNSTTLYEIAKYFNVSMEWLLTGESAYPPEITQLIADYQSLDVKYQNLIKTNIELLK